MIKNNIQTPVIQCGFDAVTYFDQLASKNKLCIEYKFKNVLCAGPLSLDGLLSNFPKANCFIAIDDTNAGTTYASDGGYFHRTTYTVWILARSKVLDMNDHAEKLNLCRTVYTQFLKKILQDKYKWQLDFTYLLNDSIQYRELSHMFVKGMTGVEFHLTVQHPLDLVWNPEEWEE